MAGRHEFQDATAIHLGLTAAEFHTFEPRAKEVFCRDYIKLLVKEHGNAKRIAPVIKLSQRAVYAIMKRYGVKAPRYYPKKRETVT